jgi:glutamate formiminotransferase / 5-formyltetrahydrofolate cyclo-ligase
VADLIECVPNFSEGRRPEVVEEIVAAIAAVEGVVVLDHSADATHNRSVVTFAGLGGPVDVGAEAGLRSALERIDITRHTGAHPRIGAVDVVPFVPLGATPMRDTVEIARGFAARVAAAYDLPTYLYGDAALRPERQRLANVRRGQYEALRTAIASDPTRSPDFGPRRLHPTAGAVAVGARRALIAFNLNLATDDLAVAKAIARTIRESSGGLPAVQAMGVLLQRADGTASAQVSTNLLDWERTGIRDVVDAVARRAFERGTSIAECELIGLAPAAALDAAGQLPGIPDLAERSIELRVTRVLGP